MNYNKEAKSLTLRRGSEVSQVQGLQICLHAQCMQLAVYLARNSSVAALFLLLTHCCYVIIFIVFTVVIFSGD